MQNIEIVSEAASIREEQHLPTIEERAIIAKGYRGPFAAFEELWSRQYRFKEFFKYIEDGSLVDYACWLPDDPVPRVFRGEIPEDVLELADLICLQCVGRTLRPAPPGAGQARITEDDPRMLVLLPENIKKKYPKEFWMEWAGSDGRIWWLTFNPCPIWPFQEGKPWSVQPYHTVLSRAEGRVRQADMNRAENLLDSLSLLIQLNRGFRMSGQRQFRLAINGWYYSEAANAPKAGASQSQAHGQLKRFVFPIERALFSKRLAIGRTSVSTLADGWGTGLAVEALEEDLETLVQVVEQILQLIVSKGHSFNVLAAPLGEGLRVFIFDRPLGTPEPLFPNEWAFAECARVVVCDSPQVFYDMTDDQQAEFESLPREQIVCWTRAQRKIGALSAINPALRQNAITALTMVTASGQEIDSIIRHLRKG